MPTSTERPIDGGWEVQLYNYEKWKPHVIKRSKIPFSVLKDLLTGLWDSKDILNSSQNRSKNNLVGENAVTRVQDSCSLWVFIGCWSQQ